MLLVLVTLSCVWLGEYVDRDRQRRGALIELRRKGFRRVQPTRDD